MIRIDFAKKVLEITDGNKGVPVVYDGVGKDTLNGSIECLAIRGMMVSFGNASGPLSDISVPKMLTTKRFVSCKTCHATIPIYKRGAWMKHQK